MPTLTSTGAVNLTSSTNWSPAQTPVNGDDLVIGAHTLTLDADMTLDSITFANASSRLAISGTSRSVQATNGFIIAATLGSSLITATLTTGTSVTLTGAWRGNFNLAGIATSTGGNLTLQTVGSDQAAVLFENLATSNTRSITGTWSAGTLTTIGRFDLGSNTQATTIVNINGGTWIHQSVGLNSFGPGGSRIANLAGTGTVNWTGSLDSQMNINGAVFAMASTSTASTIGQTGDVFLQRNATPTASMTTVLVQVAAGAVEMVGQFTGRGDAIILAVIGGAARWRNQNVSVPSTDTVFLQLTAGTTDLSALAISNAGRVFVQETGSAGVTTTSGTSITCTSTAAQACVIGTTAFDGKIVVLESSPATLPTNAQVAAGVNYGYSGAPQTGTGLIMDPATLATAMLTSFGSLPEVLVRTTIATLASQTEFTLTAGSSDNDVYNGLTAIITDQSTSVQKAVVTVSDYVGSTKTVTLSAAPGFAIATGDLITIIAGAAGGGGGSFPSEAPANWLKAAGIQDGAFTAAKFVAGSLNDKGNWAKAGDEMALTSTVLTALFADADVAALVNDIAARFDAVDDLPIATIAAACRDAILNRLLSLHTVPGSVGEAFGQIAGRATPAQAQVAATAALDAISQTALARFVTVDTGQTTAANGSVAKLAQGAGGGSGGLTTEQDEKLTEIHEAIYPEPPSSPPLVVIPSPLGSTTGWLVCRDANTSLPKSGVTVFWSLAQAPPGHYGSLLSTSEQSAISASDGVVQLPGLLPGSVYYIRSGNRPATTANIPPTAGPSTELPSMLG